MERKLARVNLSDPDPPGAFHFVFGTHPSVIERIGMARALERPRRLRERARAAWDQALGLAVGARPVGARPQVAEAQARDRRSPSACER